jgi:hypothetical protein
VNVFIVYAHPSEDSLTRHILGAFEKVMLQDRLFDRVKSKELVVFDSASRELESRKIRWEEYLTRAFKIGAEI